MKGAISISSIVGMALIFSTTTSIIISAVLIASSLWTWSIVVRIWRARRQQ